MYGSKGSPCVPECPNRTVTCKFDGTCNKYQEWEKSHSEEKKKHDDSLRRGRLYNDFMRDRMAERRRSHR